MRIKALEGSSLEELEAYHQRTHNRILPNLDQNIKNGNSLVDVSYAQFDRSIYSNISLMNKIKMFDWNAEFGNRKFDAIIGNPPYIRVQNMVHYSPEEYAFYKSNTSQYSTAVADTLDKYYLFIEKGLSLLNGNGMLTLHGSFIACEKNAAHCRNIALRRRLPSKAASIQLFDSRSKQADSLRATPV